MRLRVQTSRPYTPTDEGPIFEPLEDKEDKEDESSSLSPGLRGTSRTPDAPIKTGARTASRTRQASPEREDDKLVRRQKEMISDWINDPDHPVTEAARHSLELYGQLNDSEFAYVTELQGVYDQTRCFFLQWILGKEIKELVNSARISAVQSGNTFTWIDARAETLKSMTDVTLTARFLALSRLKRQQGTTAKLWISQVLTRKALLEDPKLRAPIHLPECLYLELLVGQMSAQETTVFDDCPAIGDDLLQTDASGRKRFTLDQLKRTIDSCSNPPYFRGVNTPITELLDSAEPKVPKQKRDQQKPSRDPSDPKKTPWKDKGDGKPKPHVARRPDHKKPTNLPEGLKRPNLDAVVDGKKIASEAQRQLYDDVKRGNCTRCHKGDHNRKDCKDPKAKWEDRFDKEGTQYWASVLKWQLKAKQRRHPQRPCQTRAHSSRAQNQICGTTLHLPLIRL